MSSRKMARYLILASTAVIFLFTAWSCTNQDHEVFPGVAKYFPAKKNANDKWSLVDAKGRFLVTKKWENQPSGVFQNRLYVEDKDGMFEYYKVSKAPEKIGGKYFAASPFSEGMAAVVAGKKDKKHIEYIDLNGKTKFKLEKLDGKQILSASRFNEGMAWVKNEDGKFGYIDKTGKLVVKCSYDLADLFHEGLARVAKETKGSYKFGFVNKEGKEVIELKNKRTYSSFSEGYSWFTDTRDNGKFKKGTINKRGKVIIQPTDDISEVGNFKNGMATFSDNDGWGLISPKGKTILRPRYTGLIQVPKGIIALEKSKWGVISPKDKELFPLSDKYQLVIPMGSGRYLVNKKDKWSFVNNKGKQKGDSFDMFEIDGIIGYEIAPESVRFEVYTELPDFGDYGDAPADYEYNAPEDVPAPAPAT